MKSRANSPLTVFAAVVGSYVFMRVEGTLDATNRGQLRDTVIKAVLDRPRGLIVDISKAAAPHASAWSMLISARWHVRHGADVPIALVSDDEQTRHLLSQSSVNRYIPVYDSFRTASEAIADGSFRYRRRAQIILSADDLSVVRARHFTITELESWCMPEPAPVASEVATLLVEDAVADAAADVALRLESDGLTVTVAVEEKCSSSPDRHAGSSGLDRVALLCRSCGAGPTPAGRKLWAVIGPENLAGSGVSGLSG